MGSLNFEISSILLKLVSQRKQLILVMIFHSLTNNFSTVALQFHLLQNKYNLFLSNHLLLFLNIPTHVCPFCKLF